MASRIRFLRPAAVVQPEIDVQKLVYDLVRDRVLKMVGPGGSFAITMRTGDEGDSVFSETIAESLAWDVSLNVETASKPAARLSA